MRFNRMLSPGREKGVGRGLFPNRGKKGPGAKCVSDGFGVALLYCLLFDSTVVASSCIVFDVVYRRESRGFYGVKWSLSS